MSSRPTRIEGDPEAKLDPDGLTPADLRKWIAGVCQRLGVTPTLLAREAGVAPSTINRFLSSDNPVANLSATTLGKITQAARDIYDHKWARGTINRQEEDVSEYGLGATEAPFIQIAPVTVVGLVSEEPSSSGPFWEHVGWYGIKVPIFSEYLDADFIAFEVDGDAVSNVYTTYSIVVCVPANQIKRDLASGDHVVATIGTNNGVDVVVREYRLDPRGDVWLLPLQGASSAARPLYIGPQGEQSLTDAAINLYLVVGSYQHTRPPT